MRILGLSCFYHDAAACLVVDGEIVAAAQEERFSRRRHDAAFPARAVRYCLAEGGIEALDAVCFYDKPLLKLHRILETHLAAAPRGVVPFVHAVPVWLREKLWVDPTIRRALRRCGVRFDGEVQYTEHHEAHAASAFFPSPFQDAAILTLDGVGEWATASLGVGEGNVLRLLEELRFPHSLGLLYTAFTYQAGFKVNSGEYKLMGLAPYGAPRFAERILAELVDLKDDGSFKLSMDAFGYVDSPRMTNARFEALFEGPPRAPEAPLTRRELDLAASIQVVLEEIVLRMARHARRVTEKRALVLAGGVALNAVANGRLLRERIFDDLWIQPAAGDAGGAVGAALAAWYATGATRRQGEGMSGALLGPAFAPEQIRAWLDREGLPYEVLPDELWAGVVASRIAAGRVVGWFEGRMEFGPRALGARSILADARRPDMQSVLNRRIKGREGFRPFAPAVLAERASEWFDLDRPSPYMLLVAPVRREQWTDAVDDPEAPLGERVFGVRSKIPAVTHVDHSARVQTVHEDTNPRFHALLRAFEAQTGCPVVVNTSFNVRGEPIVCTPSDAWRCFAATDMDDLVLWPFLLVKEQQDPTRTAAARSVTFAAD